jgi:hypothetical protein
MSLPLFPGPPDDRTPLAARPAPRLRALAERGVYLGTSSWKYQGWLGRMYTPERYSVYDLHRVFRGSVAVAPSESFPAKFQTNWKHPPSTAPSPWPH